MKVLGVYGAAGFGREVMGMLPSAAQEATEIVFIDDRVSSSKVNGRACVTWEAFLDLPADTRKVILAIGDGDIRQRLAGQCEEAGVGFILARA